MAYFGLNPSQSNITMNLTPHSVLLGPILRQCCHCYDFALTGLPLSASCHSNIFHFIHEHLASVSENFYTLTIENISSTVK